VGFFQNYQPLPVIYEWMSLQALMYPSIAKTISIGKTHEGRDILGLLIGKHTHTVDEEKKKKKAPRKQVVLIGAQHAREWITVSTLCHTAHTLLSQYKENHHVTNMVKEVDWVIVPVLNVDGYVATWEHDRLWKKNRQPTGFDRCVGIDIDRSWDFKWKSDKRSNVCSENYAGESAFAAHESKEMADFIDRMKEDKTRELIGFLDVHSYAQQILYPYAYTCKKSPADLENLEEIAFGMMKAVRNVHHQFYEAVSACNQEEDGPDNLRNTGTAVDWVYHHHVKYSFQVKIRDTGSYGYLLPPDIIVPAGEEFFGLLIYFFKHITGRISN